MDGAHKRLARWRLRMAEFNYVVQTRPGAAHHAADTMSRISTPAGDERAIPDAVPRLALPNSSAAWKLPPETKEGLLGPLKLAELLEGQAEDGRCKEVRAAMNSNDKSRFREDPNCKALAFDATWLPTFNLISTFHPLSNLTFHVARFLSDSLYASSTRYNGLHLFGGSYGHAGYPNTAWGHPARR